MPRIYTPRLKLECQSCGKTYYSKPSAAAKGGKYCSHPCYAKAKSNHVTIQCVGCGKAVPVSPSQSKIRRYCNLQCRLANMKTKIKCVVCKKARGVTPTNIKEGARFCSWECARSVLNKPRPVVICVQCAKACSVPPSRVKQGMKFCSQSCRSIHTVLHHGNKRTSIELIMYAELDRLGVSYIEQHPIREARTIPDAYIPSTRTVLYADGDYWHRLPKVAARDLVQNRELARLGYTVHRFWEVDLRTRASETIASALQEPRS